MKRFQARRASGRFTRNTAENSLGMHFNVHERKADGTWCGAFNPSTVGNPRPERCHTCGERIWEDEPNEPDPHAQAKTMCRYYGDSEQ